MKYSLVSNNELKYLHFNDSDTKLETEKDISDIIAALVEHNSQFLLFDSETLSPSFFQLKGGLVGNLIQKLSMYHIKSAIVIKDIHILKSDFISAVVDNKEQNVLKLCTNITEAENWFLSLKDKAI